MARAMSGRWPRPAWSARSPTGSPSPRCSGGRSGCRSRTPRSSRNRKDAIGCVAVGVRRDQLPVRGRGPGEARPVLRRASGSATSWPSRESARAGDARAGHRGPRHQQRAQRRPGRRPAGDDGPAQDRRDEDRAAAGPDRRPRSSSAATTARSSTSSWTAATSGSGTTTRRCPGWSRSARRPGRRGSWTAIVADRIYHEVEAFARPSRTIPTTSCARRWTASSPSSPRTCRHDPDDDRAGRVDQGPDRRATRRCARWRPAPGRRSRTRWCRPRRIPTRRCARR